MLYDNGEKYDDNKEMNDSRIPFRQEYGAFMFRYELCNVGNIRKMKVITPNIITTKIEQPINRGSNASI